MEQLVKNVAFLRVCTIFQQMQNLSQCLPCDRQSSVLHNFSGFSWLYCLHIECDTISPSWRAGVWRGGVEIQWVGDGRWDGGLLLQRVEAVAQLSVFFCSFHCPSTYSVYNSHVLDTPPSGRRPSELIKELECYLDWFYTGKKFSGLKSGQFIL